jgi:hypothetical protein
VLLDLDETLIHSEEWVKGMNYDLEVEINVEDGTKDVKHNFHSLKTFNLLLENRSVCKTIL